MTQSEISAIHRSTFTIAEAQKERPGLFILGVLSHGAVSAIGELGPLCSKGLIAFFAAHAVVLVVVLVSSVLQTSNWAGSKGSIDPGMNLSITVGILGLVAAFFAADAVQTRCAMRGPGVVTGIPMAIFSVCSVYVTLRSIALLRLGETR